MGPAQCKNFYREFTASLRLRKERVSHCHDDLRTHGYAASGLHSKTIGPTKLPAEIWLVLQPGGAPKLSFQSQPRTDMYDTGLTTESIYLDFQRSALCTIFASFRQRQRWP